MTFPFERLQFPDLVKHWANDAELKWPVGETAKMLAQAILAGEIAVVSSDEVVDAAIDALGGAPWIQLREDRPHYLLAGGVSQPFNELPEAGIQGELRANLSEVIGGSPLEALPTLRLFLIQQHAFRAWLESHAWPLPKFWFPEGEGQMHDPGAKRAHNKTETNDRDEGFVRFAKELYEGDPSLTKDEIAELISKDKVRNPKGVKGPRISRIISGKYKDGRN